MPAETLRSHSADIIDRNRESAHETPSASPQRALNILHVTRAPVGGILRHILDLASGQINAGHRVGIVADSLTGGERAIAVLAEIAPRLALGVHRLPIRREPHPGDVMTGVRLNRLFNTLAPDVLHGHGAKAGVFTRVQPGMPGTIRVYTPHGGSLHYPRNTAKGMLYAALERAVMPRTDLFLFESGFARDRYHRMIGAPDCLVRCVFNGVTIDEFEPVMPADDATDLVYVGEFRHIKGADLLVDAIAMLRAQGRTVTLTLAGDGEESAAIKAQVARLGLAQAVRFVGHVPARDGFSKGRLLVVPSRGDSMPYVVIEAAAAGVPMIAADVGGIPEVFAGHRDSLFTPGDIAAMVTTIKAALDDREIMTVRAQSLRARIFMHFSQSAMVDGIMTGYGEALTKS